MTQRFPNPTGTSSVSGWSTYDDDQPYGPRTGLKITATADGYRIRKPAGTIGGYVTSPNFSTPAGFLGVFAGWRIRQNVAGSGGIRMVGLSGISSDASVSSQFLTSKTGLFSYFYAGPTGFVTLPNIVFQAQSGEGFLTKAFDRTALILYFPEGLLDITLTNVRLYHALDNDIPAQLALDAGDAAPRFGFTDNSLSVTYSHAGTADEGVNSITLDCPAQTVTAKDGTTGPLTGTTAPANEYGDSATPGTITFPRAGTYQLRSTVKWSTSPNSGLPDLAFSSGATYSVTVPTGPFLAEFASLVNYQDLAVDGSRSVFPSNDPVTSYVWSWGDGTPTSTGQQQTHTYAAAGSYQVTLTIASSATGRTSSVTHTVTAVAPPNPGNYFTALRRLLSVTFSPSIANGTSYAWAFGDGATSTAQSPTHTYAAAGAYAVTLTVNGTQTVTQTVIVRDVRRPLRLAEVLTLEVALPWSAGTAYNRLPNPNGEQGAWGWLTPLAGSYVTASVTAAGPDDHGTAGAKLVYHSSGAGTQSWYSQAVPVSVGQYAAAQLVFPYLEGFVRLTVEALSSAGAILGASTTTAYSNATTVQRTPAYLLPAGTFTARLRVDFYSTTAGATPAAGALAQFRRAMLATAGTAAELAANPYLEGVAWQNIIGPTSRIEINRSALQLGTLSATVLDSTYDPATSGTIRPGQAVRVRVVTEDTAGIVTQDYLFAGKLQSARTTYNPQRDPSDPKLASIVLSATDATTQLTQTSAPNGVALLSELPAILEGAGVPYEINGGSGQVPTASTVSVNPNASVLDQVAITRDSTGSYAYVSRSGVLVAVDPQHMTGGPVGLVSEDTYSAVDAAFSTASVINSVSIVWLRYTPANGTAPATLVEIPYGPFEDADSIATWGRQTTTQPFKLQGFAESASVIQARANAILTANKTPVRLISGATLPIRYVEDVTRERALLELYDPVIVRYSRTGTNTVARITSVKHTITPASWSMALGFTPDGAVASPQLTAAPPAAAGSSGGAGGSSGKLSVQVAASAAVVIGTANTDVPGMTTTLTVTASTQRYLITAVWDIDTNNTGGGSIATCKVSVGSTVQAASASYQMSGSIGRTTVSQTYLVTGLSPGSVVVKGLAISTVAAAYRIQPTNSTLTVVEL